MWLKLKHRRHIERPEKEFFVQKFDPAQAVYKQKAGFQRLNFWNHTALESQEENQPALERPSLIHGKGQQLCSFCQDAESIEIYHN